MSDDTEQQNWEKRGWGDLEGYGGTLREHLHLPAGDLVFLVLPSQGGEGRNTILMLILKRNTVLMLTPFSPPGSKYWSGSKAGLEELSASCDAP